MRYARGILEMTDGKNTSVSKDTSLEFYYLNLRNKWKMQIAAQWTYWHKNQNMWSATAKMLQELRWDAFCLAKKWSAFLSSHYLKLTQVSAVFSHTKALFLTQHIQCYLLHHPTTRTEEQCNVHSMLHLHTYHKHKFHILLLYSVYPIMLSIWY